MPVPGVKSEERLIPIIRAELARKLSEEGFSSKDIATALNVTQAAVTQYIKRKRGAGHQDVSVIGRIIEPVAEKLVMRVRSGLGPIETVELLETARQLMVMNAGRTLVEEEGGSDRSASLGSLRERLKLELTAAEKYLELANRTSDDHTKLLLRMIASDSIRHADVVSQVISWLEAGGKRGAELPSKEILEGMLSMEDSAKEVSLQETVQVDHPVARLLLEWIDRDEAKHGKMVAKMLSLDKKRAGRASGKT